MKNKIVCDVCWTMYKSNTTFDFIDFVMEKEVKHKLKFFLIRLSFLKIFMILLGRVFNFDIYRYFYISLLEGFGRKELEEYVDLFLYNFLNNKKISFTFELLNDFDKNREDIVLCSASLDIVVSKISAQYGYQYFSSELEFVDGICTGKLKRDLLADKHSLFENDTVDCVVTDNLSDYELVKISRISKILSTKKNMNFWLKRNIKVDYVLEVE